MRKKSTNQPMEASVNKIMEEYGQEMVTEYQYDAADQHDAKVLSLSQEDFEAMKQIEGEIINRLETAVKQNLSPNSTEAVEIARMHKKWLKYTWADYNTKLHLNLVDSYQTDNKFRAYYDKNVKGCADFLRTAVRNYIYKEEPKESPQTDLNR